MKLLCVLVSIILSFGLAHAQANHPPLGMVTMALLNKGFPVEEAAEVLRVSPHPAFAFLWKSFGKRNEHILDLLSLLRADPTQPLKPITVIAYLDCGPCRPPRRPKGLFPLILPNKSSTQLDSSLRRCNPKVIEVISHEITLLLDSLPQLDGVQYVLVPSLEDTLSNQSFQTLLVISQSLSVSRLDVSYARNRLLQEPIHTVRQEVHTSSLSLMRNLKPGDIVTGDGEMICYPGQAHCAGTTLGELRALISLAAQRQLAHLVWTPESQGVSSQLTLVPPNKRVYKITHKRYLKQLLKG